MITRLVITLVIVAGAALFALWWQRRDGRVRTDKAGRFSSEQLRALGLELGSADAVAVLLGSPTCSPCVTVKQILGELAAERTDFRWSYADAADHLDIADAHHVMRVPTLFVLDREGRILARTSGVPAKVELRRVLDREGSLEAV